MAVFFENSTTPVHRLDVVLHLSPTELSFHTRHHLWTDVAAMIFSYLSQHSYSPGSVQAGSPSAGFSFRLTINRCFGSAFLLYYVFGVRSSRLLYFSFILVAF